MTSIALYLACIDSLQLIKGIIRVEYNNSIQANFEHLNVIVILVYSIIYKVVYNIVIIYVLYVQGGVCLKLVVNVNLLGITTQFLRMTQPFCKYIFFILNKTFCIYIYFDTSRLPHNFLKLPKPFMNIYFFFKINKSLLQIYTSYTI